MYKRGERPIIAVDFDGTIAKSYDKDKGYLSLEEYELLNNINVALELLRRNKCRLILYTVRRGKALVEAVTFCNKWNIYFDAINEDLPDVIEHLADIGKDSVEEFKKLTSSKPYADVYYDDKNLGGLQHPNVLLDYIRDIFNQNGWTWTRNY